MQANLAIKNIAVHVSQTGEPVVDKIKCEYIIGTERLPE